MAGTLITSTKILLVDYGTVISTSADAPAYDTRCSVTMETKLPANSNKPNKRAF